MNGTMWTMSSSTLVGDATQQPSSNVRGPTTMPLRFDFRPRRPIRSSPAEMTFNASVNESEVSSFQQTRSATLTSASSASSTKKPRLDVMEEERGYRQLSYGSDMATTVRIYLGVEGKLFVLHQSALCDVSPFFKKTFLGNSKEAREKKLDLPVTDPGTFKMFVEWLYSRKIIINGRDEEDSRGSRLPSLADLYIFADGYDMPQLANDAMGAIILFLQNDYPLPGPDTVRSVYENLSENSPLCKLLVNEYARTGQELAGSPDRWPTRFVFDAFNAANRARRSNNPIPRPSLDSSNRHQHSSYDEPEHEWDE